MNPPLAHEGLGTVASRLAVRIGEGNWSALVVPYIDAIPSVTEDLAFETELLLGEPVARIEDPSDDNDLVTRLRGIAGGVVLVSGLERFTTNVWRRLDLLRDRLEGRWTVACLLTLDTLATMEREAPNLASWLGTSVAALDEGAGALTEDDRASRLLALRGHFAMTDEELLTRASRGELPADPHLVEWLTLLGRGDLIDHGD